MEKFARTASHLILQWRAREGESMESFLSRLAAEEGLFPGAEAGQLARDTVLAVAAVEGTYQCLRAYRQTHGTREQWLRTELASLAGAAGLTPEQLASQVTLLIDRANAELLGGALPAGGRAPLPLLLQTAGTNSVLFAYRLEDGHEPDTTQRSPEHHSALHDLLGSELGSQTEIDTKTILTFDLLLHAQPGESAESRPLPVMAAALVVDRAYAAAKVAYLIGTGKMNPVAAADYLFDRTVSNLVSGMKSVIAEMGADLGTSLGTVLGVPFGPAGLFIGAAVGRYLGTTAGAYAAEKIALGTRKLAHVARSAVRALSKGTAAVIRGAATYFRLS